VLLCKNDLISIVCVLNGEIKALATKNKNVQKNYFNIGFHFS
jgi:hypothetical protein